jgi:hypothetical protein
MFATHSPARAARLVAVAALVCFFTVSAATAATAADSAAPARPVVKIRTVVAIQSGAAATSAASASGAAPAQPPLPRNVVARVNGQAVTRAELADKLLKYFGEQALETIIQQAAIRQEAKAEGLAATDQDVDRAENDFYARGPKFPATMPPAERKEVWANTLRSRGLTVETFRHDLEIDILVGKMVARRLNITDEDLQAEFKKVFPTGSPGENVKFDDVQAGLRDRLTKERTAALRPQVIAEILKKADVQRGALVPQGSQP